jgi:hypothetical protein
MSVPITWAYNHHYTVALSNRNKAWLIRKATTPETAHLSHGSDTVWVVDSLEENTERGNDATTVAPDDDSAAIPHYQFISSEGNSGEEMRKSYHSYPKGYAQLIQSPDTFTVSTPMQIDTWNRNMAPMMPRF